jgi:hypothetical protein
MTTETNLGFFREGALSYCGVARVLDAFRSDVRRAAEEVVRLLLPGSGPFKPYANDGAQNGGWAWVTIVWSEPSLAPLRGIEKPHCGMLWKKVHEEPSPCAVVFADIARADDRDRWRAAAGSGRNIHDEGGGGGVWRELANPPTVDDFQAKLTDCLNDWLAILPNWPTRPS